MTQEHREKSGFETRAIHAGWEPDPTTGAVIPPIFATSTYKQDGVGGLRGGYEYSRSANPTRTALEDTLAALEEGERGFAFASGLAAEDTVARGLLDPGDHVVLPNDAYGGTHRLFDKVLQPLGRRAHAGRAVRPRRRQDAITDRTKMIWVETPTNPLLGIADIAGPGQPRARGRRAAGRRQHLRDAVPPASADPRRRRRHPLHDEVRRRAQRRRRWRGRGARPRPRRERRLPPERHGRRGRSVRRLAHPARPQDARGPDGAALRQRREGRGVPHRRRAGRARLLPGPCRPPGPRGREGADVPLRRHGRLPRRRAARSRRSRSATGPGCSRWPSRSAASSR